MFVLGFTYASMIMFVSLSFVSRHTLCMQAVKTICQEYLINSVVYCVSILFSYMHCKTDGSLYVFIFLLQKKKETSPLGSASPSKGLGSPAADSYPCQLLLLILTRHAYQKIVFYLQTIKLCFLNLINFFTKVTDCFSVSRKPS